LLGKEPSALLEHDHNTRSMLPWASN